LPARKLVRTTCSCFRGLFVRAFCQACEADNFKLESSFAEDEQCLSITVRAVDKFALIAQGWLSALLSVIQTLATEVIALANKAEAARTAAEESAHSDLITASGRRLAVWTHLHYLPRLMLRLKLHAALLLI
jgi:hypothetical protein